MTTTLTAICTAIKSILDGVPDIDESTINGYLPPIETRKVALVIPPMGMEGTVGAPVGRKTRLIHRIPCELWVKVDSGKVDDSMRRGREVCLAAAAELQANPTLNDTVSFLGDGTESPPFAWRVGNELIDLGKATFIPAVLTVTVTEWVTLTA